MGNASEDLKAVTTHVTNDVEDEGLANAFTQLQLLAR